MYLFFDTETTGFGHNANITQLAFKVFNKEQKLVTEFSELIKPKGWKVPKVKFFIENNMSTERCEKYGIPIEDAMDAFYKAISICEYKIAHNLAFDTRMTLGEIRRCKLNAQTFINVKGFCTMEGTKNIDGIALNHAGRGKKPSLKDLHEFCFQKGFEDAHDAMADVNAMAKSFFKLLNKELIKLQ